MKNNLNNYLALVKKRKAEREKDENLLIKLPMPSGMEWILTPVNPMQLTVAGKLPITLLGKVNQSERKPTEQEMVGAGIAAMEMTRDVMLNNLVFPRITLEPSPDSICISDVGEKIDVEDFTFFMEWLLNGSQVNADASSKSATDKRKSK